MNNDAAIGYMILAASRLKFDPKLIAELETAMYRSMDEHTEEEAEDAYRSN